MKFDWTMNLGHVLTIVTLAAGGFLAYLSIEVRISAIDLRTVDYSTTRDLARTDAARLDALAVLVQNSQTINQQVLGSLAMAREDIASIKATVEAIRRPSGQP